MTPTNLRLSEDVPNCNSIGTQHIPEYVGLVVVDWDTGFCQEGYICRHCRFKAQRPTMFAPEALHRLHIYSDAVELKTVGGVRCQRRAGGTWREIGH